MKNRIVHQHTKLDADYVDLRMLFQSIIEKKWFILTVGFIIFTLAITYAFVKPTKYQASILLKVQHTQHNVLGTIANPNQQLGLANISEEPLAVQMALIQSEFILRPVIKSLGLDISISPYKHSFFDFLFKQHAGQISISELDIPTKYLKKPLHLVIDAHKHYRLFNQHGDILIQGNEGYLASNKDSVAIKIDKINSPAGSEFTLIKDQEFDILGKIRANLNIADLSGSSENNSNKVAILRVSLIGNDPVQITNILDQIAITTQQQNMKLKALDAEKTLEFLNKQLPVIQESLKKAETRLNEYRSTNGRIDIKFQTQYLLNHLSEINKQLEKLRLQKINLLQKFTSNHPFVISLSQEINESEKNRHELMNQLNNLPASEQEALNLTREVNVKNNLYMILLNQIHQLEVIKKGIMSDIQILAPASTPYMLQSMKPTVIGFFGLFVGLILGCMGVLGWRILIQRIDDPNWTEHIWNINNLAIIPYSKEQAFNSLAIQSQARKSLPLLAYKSHNDIAIESLCSLRTFLQLALEHSHNNIIAMMGISKGVGKTFITANLASLLARIGNSVLVIDGDIRDGHMNQYFLNASTSGLTDVIHGKITIEQAVIHPKECENLAYLPAGTQSERAADLLICDSFKSLLLDLSKKYQYIFINTPPNISNTDNFLIGSLAGINLLVLGAHMHEAADIDMVIKRFNHAGIKLNGCIFNNLKSNKKKYYHSRSQLVNENNNVTTLRYHGQAP